MSNLVLPGNQKPATNRKINQSALGIKYIDHPFKILDAGTSFGEECLILNQPSLYTVVCKSLEGTILKINEQDFVKRVRLQEEVFKKFE